MQTPVSLVGIAGASGSGKSTLATLLAAEVGSARATVISLDWYYHCGAHLPEDERSQQVFDHPDAIDSALMARHLDELKAGKPVMAPGYDFAGHVRIPGTAISPRPLIIVEGFLLLCFEEIRQRLDTAIYVIAPREMRFERRIRRDVEERGRDPVAVRRQLERDVIPSEEQFIIPSAQFADVVVLNDGDRSALLRQVVELPWQPPLDDLFRSAPLRTTGLSLVNSAG